MRGYIFAVATMFWSGFALAQQEPSSSAPVPAEDALTQPNWKRQADWKRVPDLPSMMSVYPARARKLNVTGKAVMSCVVTRKGQLRSCKTVSENPTNFGFGAAEVALAPYFQMTPAIVNGKPVEAEIAVPMRFDLK